VGATPPSILAPVQTRASENHAAGDAVVLRYVTTAGQIEMCWPCRVVADRDDLVALFIAAGSPYKAGPKKSAAQKRRHPPGGLPPDEYVWRPRSRSGARPSASTRRTIRSTSK
jgi:hypothetical protein